MHDLILEMSFPRYFFACETILNAHLTAALYPSSVDKSLPIFDKLRKEVGVPVLTDIHTAEQCSVVANHVDVLQIPAFLCRQTD